MSNEVHTRKILIHLFNNLLSIYNYETNNIYRELTDWRDKINIKSQFMLL